MRNFVRLFLVSISVFLVACAELGGNYGSVSPWVVEQNDTRLRTIESFIQSGKPAAALDQAKQIQTGELTPSQNSQFNLLYAQILLDSGEAEQAVSRLNTIDIEQLSLPEKIKLLKSQTFAYSLTGNVLEQAKARIVLDGYLTNPVERKKNQGIILESLGLLPANAPISQGIQPVGFAEWLSVAQILSNKSQTPSQFNAALTNWRSANSQHPANLYLADVKDMSLVSSPNTIAVLLPESGAFADAAKAIKAGFMAAHSRDNTGGSKPALHFYDTEKGKAAEIYQKAVSEGAKLVVGPLGKDKIEGLATDATLTVPVLALNVVDGLSKANLYQFALSPKDDVAELTQKAATDGRRTALLLVPGHDQGKRIAGYFSEDWQRLGGNIINSRPYDPAYNEFTFTLNKLLGNEGNNATTNADALFLSAYSKEGRTINSQLQTLAPKSLGVYALPSIYSGTPDPINDNALNGVTFCDVPWLFESAYNGDLSLMALRNIWSQFPNTYIRLVAMGIDAYQLIAQLPVLGSSTFQGATGKLSLTPDNRIKRNLMCAKFVQGQAVPVGYNNK